MLNQATLVTLGFAFIFLGFIIMFLSVLLLVFRTAGTTGKTRGAGLIMIGPIPILLGTDKETVKTLLILAVVLMGLVLAVMLIPHFIHQ